MKNQQAEEKLYTDLGHYVIDSLEYNAIQNWDKAVLTIQVTDGLMTREINYFGKDNKERIRTVPNSESRVDIFELVEKLKEYTESNNYTRWNKFDFELISNHKFEIAYSWDQNFHDNRE